MNSNSLTENPAAERTNNRGRRRRSLWKAPTLIAAIIVSILLMASHFVRGWNWAPGAFVVVGILLFGIGFAYQLVTRKRDTIAYRAAAGIAMASAFILTWGNLVQWADVNPAAVMYFGVPVVAVIGVAMARLQPTGMALALLATALAQVLVLACALTFLMIQKPRVTSWTPPELRGFIGNAILALLFAGSALLFWRAGRRELAPEAV